MRDYTGVWHPAEDYRNDAMMVQFYTKPVPDKEAMARALEEENDDRIMWMDTVCARLRSPADTKSDWDYEVDKYDRGKAPQQQLKVRFRAAFDAFQRGAKDEIVGTPLAEWSEITRSMVMNLNQLGFLSVEDVASVHDDNLMQLGQHGRKIRDRARVALEPKDKAQVAMQATIDDQAREIENLKAMMEQMRNIPAQPSADVESDEPKRRGRPPKMKEAA